MNKYSLPEDDEFIPVMSSLINDSNIGFMGALIFGVVWYFGQKDDRGVCRKTYKEIAQFIGISKEKTLERLIALVSHRYLGESCGELYDTLNRPRSVTWYYCDNRLWHGFDYPPRAERDRKRYEQALNRIIQTNK